ncbi:kynureninase [Rhodanobacter thiooxydans]|uniref:Kynureninase n=1 Tax=Rhodanobacter thiooxydans TaxID=416169 RepID=A0A154QE24_9GAMM|nr:kynureninase [Rhodanobacter thiooxydans]EIM00697.1 kynureninase [Rhodanobacter thiooxydans LCS2]KZC22245.1 kynureninase [Rhodanobacter thiooxydans]MCW0203494.1 kynureninase [Rhodanobacter thiooxydans]
MPASFEATLDWAGARDATDPLRAFRDEFMIPPHEGRDGRLSDSVYFCGNSLGLQPRAVREAVNAELDYWGELGVEGHFKGRLPWMDYHEFVRDDLAAIVGAQPTEVVTMNTLGVNLHLMMVSFYRPTAERPAILIEAGTFPTDRYAVESQIRFHGFDPATALIELPSDEPNGTTSLAAIERALAEHGSRIALVLLPGVQYRTGQAFDLEAITALGHKHGCTVGFDLAHAVGNLPLQLHDSGADFAIWCSYKYLNSGPGAVGGAFVHERHAQAVLPRFAGWWGHDKTTRFQMGPEFHPTPGADGWQLSNPPILALAPLRVSLEIFRRAGMARLREKSLALTGYLEWLVNTQLADVLEVVTPAEAERRGAQLSIRVTGGRERGRELFAYLMDHGIIGDWREPDVIRISPAPLYNRFADCLVFAEAVSKWSRGG